jgi:hypothetical protein
MNIFKLGEHGGPEDGKKRELLIEGLTVFFQEFFYPAGRINKFLLAGEKRMAGGTDLHSHFRIDAADGYFVAAGAYGIDLMILGMDIFFHRKPPKL